MPRQSRIDAPGALHHIITRGIERSIIFKDKLDREDFITRLGGILSETATKCFAWSLMSNHFHLLLQTGRVPLVTVMRRLLTGYAIKFNRRHKRHGHLFQNRYKSILCQEDSYFAELVRYIHLNPLRAKMVKDIKALDTYPYSGHSVIMGKRKLQWQSIDSMLLLFGTKISKARFQYRKFIEKGIKQGKRDDLIGGGLIRSAGGWSKIKDYRKSGVFLKSDERVLGDTEFVKSVLKEAQEAMDQKYILAAKGIDLKDLTQLVSELFQVPPGKLLGPGKSRDVVKARSLLCHWAVKDLGWTMTELAKKLLVSVPTVSVSVQRGLKIAAEKGWTLISLLNIKM